MEMKSSLFTLIVLVFFVKGFMSETDVANQASNSGATCVPLLDNILRLERAVNNMSWELELTKNELKSTKAALEVKEDRCATVFSTCSRVDMMEERIEKIANLTEKRGMDREIAFQVDQIKRPYNPSQNEPLKFDDVTLNRGGGYNPTSGIFTVPRNGIYLCWASVMSHLRNRFVLRLMKEGEEIVRAYTGSEQMFGTAVITYLKTFTKGEHLWFDVLGDPLSIAGEKYSSYGCHLMYV